ncbi:MAG: aminoglycoside phosphotransferase family protein [Gammaproteobacteria bacterium]
MIDQRLEKIKQWLTVEVDLKEFSVEPASEDASFRRYFRVYQRDKTLIVMDAPPDKEDCRPFIEIATGLSALGLNVPRIIQSSPEQGFLLLSDLGTRLYLNELTDITVDALYRDAMASLLKLQTAAQYHDIGLPIYDETLLLNEMVLFRDWYLIRHLKVTIDDSWKKILDDVFELLVENALEQPQVWVHRDFHSRNLIVTSDNNPGILDFQDAVIGPVTYDLVSLLRDCYKAWPQDRLEHWIREYISMSESSGLFSNVSERQYCRWFDLMGLQRHLKAIGIFSRLKYRDNKPGYMLDIPRTIQYVIKVTAIYPELSAFNHQLSRVAANA